MGRRPSSRAIPARVFEQTAYGVSALISTGSEGGGNVTRYLVVPRRGLKSWRRGSVTVVSESRAMAARRHPVCALSPHRAGAGA